MMLFAYDFGNLRLKLFFLEAKIDKTLREPDYCPIGPSQGRPERKNLIFCTDSLQFCSIEHGVRSKRKKTRRRFGCQFAASIGEKITIYDIESVNQIQGNLIIGGKLTACQIKSPDRGRHQTEIRISFVKFLSSPNKNLFVATQSPANL